MKAFTAVCAVLACLLSGAALAVSLLHVGPAGPRGRQGPSGPQGNAGRAAQTARLGLCWSESVQDNGGVAWVDSVSIDQPVLSSGVYTCPQGDTFVSIVPQSPPSPSGG